jgi:acyl-CoA synthetase (AMP-forming)/AMP-acid ligase II
MVENWKEIYQAAGVSGGDRVYFAFSFGPFIGFWLAFDAAQQLGCLCIPGGGLSTAGRLRAIAENRATVLCCTPSYAAHLAETAARENFDLKATAVRLLIVAGEPGGSVPATRRRLEELWPGARIFDHHGMTETGPVSHECPCPAGHVAHSQPRLFGGSHGCGRKGGAGGRGRRISLDGVGPHRLAPAAVSHGRLGAGRRHVRLRAARAPRCRAACWGARTKWSSCAA